MEPVLWLMSALGPVVSGRREGTGRRMMRLIS
jgi:hypothetical protein